MLGQQLDLFAPFEIGTCYAIAVNRQWWNHQTQKPTYLVSETKVFNSEKEAQKELSRFDKALLKKHRFKIRELSDWEIEHLKELDEIERF